MVMDIAQTLSPEDIEEKIAINQRDFGYDLIEFKSLLEHELFLIERDILVRRLQKLPLHVTSDVQAQNLKEQIAYVNNKILKELSKNGYLPVVHNSIHDENKSS